MKSLLLLLSISLYSTFVFAQADPCASISINGGNGQITVSGLSGAAIAGVQVFNSSWASVFNQTYTNPSGTVNVSPLGAGQYFVNVRLYTNSWASICEKGASATVINGPPASDTCGPTFQKTLGLLAGDEMAINIAKSADGGYLTVGQAAASGTTNHDALVMKLDSKGSLLWSKTLGGAQEDFFSQVVATPDGGCIAAGATNSNGYGPTFSGDCWFARFDGSGNLLWQKRYFVSGTPGTVYHLISTSDGGFAFSGTFPFTPGVADWMVVKADANGNIQWQKKLGSGNSDNATGIIEDDHGGAGLIVGGNIYSNTWYDAVITKLDMSGNVMWTKTYDFDSRANWLGPIHKVSDGLVFHIINVDGFAEQNVRPGALKTDFNGNVTWVKEFVIGEVRDARMTVLPDGGIMMSMGELHHDAASELYLMRTDPAGNVMWAKKYPRAGAQWLYSLVSDGNFVVGAGLATSGSYNDVMLVKADLNGRLGTCSSLNVTVTPRNLSVGTPAFNWTANTSLALSTANTAYALAVNTPNENIVCADNCAPAITISNVTVSENAGNAVLQVCLPSPATSTVLYSYTTTNGSATSGSDYTGGAGTVTIAAGQTCGTITIPILNDAVAEPAENFTVSIGSVSGTVTINDDEQAQNTCDGVTITPGSNLITISGITAPVATVQVFNSSWATVFNQTYTNSPGTVNVNIGPGTYLVKVTFYTSNWAYVCDKSVNNVTVVNNCPPGAICISNSCPSPTVDLNTAYAPVLPAGTTVSWHTGTPATDANKMTAEQAQNVSTPGTYYAAIHISGANCYSATIPVNVTIVPCSSASPVVNAVQVKSEDQLATRSIMAFPNPFTRSVRVIIDSEKKEKAMLSLMDVQGRPLKQMPVQLVPGSNTVLMEGLEQFPVGNYFLRISSGNGIKTLKLMRQQ